jgi:predicted nucleotidyltransferase
LNYIANRPVQVFLYGSRARNTARKTSDVDIALLAANKLPDGFIAHLRELIEESTIPYQVDIIDLNEVDNDFRQKILQEAKPWNA